MSARDDLSASWAQPTTRHPTQEESLETLSLKLQAASRLQAIYSAYEGATGVRRAGSSRPSSTASSQTSQRSSRLHTSISCRVMAHQNGSLVNPVSVVARSLSDLLSQCTARFSMNFAARRAFDREGHELKCDVDLALLDRDAQIFVSAGEPFRDPIQEAQRRLLRVERMERRGPMLPPPATNASTRSERVQSLLAHARPRVLVFVNGDGRSGTQFGFDYLQVVQGPLESFFYDCASKLRLPALPKRLFNLLGEELTAVPTQLCDTSLFWLIGRVIGPLWVTNGAPLANEGRRRFVKELRSRLMSRQQSVAARLEQFSGADFSDPGAEVTRRLDHLLDVDKMTLVQLRSHSDQLQETLEFLRRVRATIDDSVSSGTGHESLVPVIDEKSRLLGRPPLRLLLFTNGQDGAPGTEKVLCFDVRRFEEIAPQQPQLLEHLLDQCTLALHSPSKGRRLFFEDGREVTNVLALKRNTRVWMSCGEPFVMLTRSVLDVMIVYPSDAGPSDASHLARPNGDVSPSKVVCCSLAQVHRLLPSQKWSLELDSNSSWATLKCAAHPDLVATVDPEQPTSVILAPPQTPLPKTQLWAMSSLGTISSASSSTLVLSQTLPPKKSSEEEDASDDAVGGGGLPVQLQPLSDMQTQVGRRQRWGIKQNNFATIGQWRLTVTPFHMRDFVKDALLWPVLPSGAWNDEMQWPVVGAFVAQAQWDEVASANATAAPRAISVRVLPNGAKELDRAVNILIAPVAARRSYTAVTALELPLASTAWLAKHGSQVKSSDLEVSPATVQLNTFLDDCTRCLRLPRAVKQVFSSLGVALSDVSTLKQDELVYVSYGEAFIHPSGTEKLMRQISQELELLRSYNALAFVKGLALVCPDDGTLTVVVSSEQRSLWQISDTRHIQCMDREGMVLEAAALSDGSAVVLAARDEMSIKQKWVLDSHGFVQSAMDASLVLAVQNCGVSGASVILSSKLAAEGGVVIEAYAASLTELALTAATQCNICTFSVTSTNPASQLAFSNDGGAQNTSLVCSACHSLEGTIGGPLGAQIFACSRGQRESTEKGTVDTHSPLNHAVQLGARVNLATKESCMKEIERWAKEEQRLQPPILAAPKAPTAALDSKTRLRVRLFKNGEIKERKSAVVLLPAHANRVTQMDMLLQEATSTCCSPTV